MTLRSRRPGWRPDPRSGAGWERYHDGSHWTSQVRAPGQPYITPQIDDAFDITPVSRRRLPQWSRRSWAAAATAGALLAGGTTYAVGNWTIGLTAGSAGEAQSGTVGNLIIAATASPAATNLLYPGGNGDAVLTITNNNAYPVTITAVNLPANTVYATGYTTSALSTAQAGCTSALSLVTWNYSTSTSGTSHTLTTALTVAANGTLTVTLTNDATMDPTSPAACESSYFSLPSLTGVTATGGAATATTSPATDAWTS